jgi:mRNA interferase MazF
MRTIRQGEIWWVNFPQPAGRRPALVLTRTDAVARMTNVTVAPLTRTIRGIDSEVVVSPQHGVPTVCAISLDNIATVRKSLLDRRLTMLSSEMMREVFAAIRFVFSMP